MANEGILSSIPTLTASADLSALQFRFVDISGDNTVNVSGAAASAIGILQNDPLSGDAADVAGPGSLSKATASASITAGADLATATGGKVATATAGQNVVAKAVTGAGADNEIFTVLVTLAPSP